MRRPGMDRFQISVKSGPTRRLFGVSNQEGNSELHAGSALRPSLTTIHQTLSSIDTDNGQNHPSILTIYGRRDSYQKDKYDR
jgi:hypothetical protein